ncbi:hypothetical protein ACA910_018632 [Epithemia clementina (nom. ined.)]
MIEYDGGSFGIKLLFRLHGSAVFKSLTPAAMSSAIFFAILYTTGMKEEQQEHRILEHPYAIGALIAALSFLLSFRADFSYNRYWEAFTAIHEMHSRWMDVGMELAAFHLQSNKYDHSRPPAFGEYPELTCLERERERLHEPTMIELEHRIDEIMAQHAEDFPEDVPRHSLRQQFTRFLSSKFKSITKLSHDSNTNLGDEIPKEEGEQKDLLKPQKPQEVKIKHQPTALSSPRNGKEVTSTSGGIRKSARGRLSGPSKHSGKNRGIQNQDHAAVHVKTNSNPSKRAIEEDKPPLLLQEAAHLLSLLSAVAMSTLRNDLEEADTPLSTFVPGAPWPHVDPDSYGADVRKDWTLTTHRTWTVFSYLLGTTRTRASCTLYNAARPFRVIGGVSDAEIEMLQSARGPFGKVALCSMWLEEFCSREHLNGGLGEIGAPIISRLYQFISDGMVGYNQARKIAYIPFPFPHAQMTFLFVVLVACMMPVLMLSYVTKPGFAFFLNLVTVMSFSGVHAVAQELEDPFTNVPNDMPLNNFQAQFNEGLMQMFAGFHPDAYWEIYEENADESPEANINGSYPPTKARVDSMSMAVSEQIAVT